MVGVNEKDIVPVDLREEGERRTEQDTQKNILLRGVKRFAKKAYRTILVCYRDMSMTVVTCTP